MASTYGWESLRRVGDFVVCEGKTARQVSSMAKAYIERHVSPEAIVAAVSTPAGDAVVFLAYVPRTEDPAPPPKAADAKRERHEADEREREARRRKSMESTFRNLHAETSGYEYVRPSNETTVEDKIESELASLRAGGASQAEVEDLRDELERKHGIVRGPDVVKNYDKIWD